jgi:Tfp pilus assembly protein PilN
MEAVRTEPQAYSTQAIQEVRIQQLEQEIAVLKQRNADLTMCL